MFCSSEPKALATNRASLLAAELTQPFFFRVFSTSSAKKALKRSGAQCPVSSQPLT